MLKMNKICIGLLNNFCKHQFLYHGKPIVLKMEIIIIIILKLNKLNGKILKLIIIKNYI